MREEFSRSLVELGREIHNLVVLDGDCSHSTRSYRFRDVYPGRFINAGIAEQNMVGMAAGMAKAGQIPIVCGFAAIMVHRAAEQLVQSIAYSGTDVKIVGHYAGVSAASEGAPHHSIADIALVRSIPNFTILCPANDSDVDSCLREAIETCGPVYLRLSRNPVAPQPQVEWNRFNGYWRTAFDGQIAILSIGGMSDIACQAAALLADKGMPSTVIPVRRLKPFPHALQEELTSGRFQVVATIEDHSVIGGLGGAIAEFAGGSGTTVLRFGIEDRFTESGAYNDLLRALGVTADQIVQRISKTLRRK